MTARRQYIWLFLLGAVLQMVVGAAGWREVLAGSLDDPDSYMRLLRILQGVQQGYLVNQVARDGPGAGVTVEWSKLLDGLLWLMALPLAPIFGWRQALFTAGVALGPLGAGCLSVAVAFAARPFSRTRWLWAAPLTVAVLPAIETFDGVGVVHYHILLLALIGATGGFVARAWDGDTGLAFMAGLSGGFAIWLTPETMPFVLMAYAALFLRWLTVPIGAVMAACGAGCFDVLGFGFAVDPPQGGYAAVQIDRLSIVYVVLGLCLLSGGLMLWRLRDRKRRRVIGIAVLGGLLLGWMAVFPGVVLGPYGVMNAADRHLFFGVMQELQPVTNSRELVLYLLPGVLAVAYCVFKAWRGRLWVWLYAAVCGLVALVLGQRFILFVEFSGGFAAVLLPIALHDAARHYAARPVAVWLAPMTVLLAVLLLPRLPALAHGRHVPARPIASSCNLRQIAALLAPAAGAVVLAPVEDTPEILWRSQVQTVGSFYQHGVAGYLRAWAAFRSAPADDTAVLKTGARYVLICPGVRYRLVADLPPVTLWDRLNTGQPPPWLVLKASNAAGFRLYEVYSRPPG